MKMLLISYLSLLMGEVLIQQLQVKALIHNLFLLSANIIYIYGFELFDSKDICTRLLRTIRFT